MIITIMAEEERYSNRQIERLLDEQSKDIMRHIDDATEPILAQTTKTNGRVTKNEEDIIKSKIWRGWLTGGMAVISILIPVIVAIQAWEILQILEVPHEVQQAIDDRINSNTAGN